MNRFLAQMVCSPAKDEEMLVYAFKKGVLPGPFCEALIKAHPATFAEVRRLAVAHIADESEVAEKRGSVAPARPRAQTRIDENQIKEAFINEGRGHSPTHLKFFLLVFSK